MATSAWRSCQLPCRSAGASTSGACNCVAATTGQAELSEKVEHLGSTHDECLGADIERLPADPFGAQHTAEPVSRIEQGDLGPRSGREPQAIRRDES